VASIGRDGCFLPKSFQTIKKVMFWQKKQNDGIPAENISY